MQFIELLLMNIPFGQTDDEDRRVHVTLSFLDHGASCPYVRNHLLRYHYLNA
jgi:hypothetical protein